jgi:hypothetical protein
MNDATLPPPPPPIEPGMPAAPPPGPMARLPWEEPGRPFVEALFETVKLFVTRPSEAYARMAVEGDLIRPVLYAIILGWVGVFFAQVFNIAMGGFQMGMMRRWGMNASAVSPMVNIAIIVAAPLLVIIGLAIQTVVFHLVLMLIGGATRGFDATLRACCYAGTAQLAGIVPVCGGLVGLVWAIVLLVIGIATAHRTTQGKAALAVILPGVLCCACGVVLAIVFGATLAGLANR